MDHIPDGWRFVYVATAAAAGAVTALGSKRWRTMTAIDIVLTLGIGFTFAIFVTPWIAHQWLGVAEGDNRALLALTYLFGSASNILLPFIIRHLRKMLGEGDTQ
jgi:hypothetical protein